MSENPLEKRLADEKFSGRKIVWKTFPESIVDFDVEVAEDSRNYFLKISDRIYFQAKEGTPEERKSYCFDCGGQVQIKEQSFSLFDQRTNVALLCLPRFRPYCPKCDPEPEAEVGRLIPKKKSKNQNKAAIKY